VRGTVSRDALAGLVAATFWIAAASACASREAGGPVGARGEARAPERKALQGPQLEGPELDARGADFSEWLDDFEKKTHYNWDPPTYFGYGGSVEFMFTVEQNGTLSMVDQVTSSGSEALDEAARRALTHSRYEPLPEGFPRLRVTMRVVFHYYPSALG